jgi:gamma-glutamylcyclotransferase (GGCT)/AIG2-like uncharacterized protein YtfP
MNKILYFAYGSNMDNFSMKRRCPGAENLGQGFIEDWSLRERICADISQAPGEKVFGVVWAVTPKCIKALDFYEGCPNLYKKIKIKVTWGESNNVSKAIVYVMTKKSAQENDDQPFERDYRNICAEGAKMNGVPVHQLFTSIL